MLGSIDLATARGLEIGPLANPLVRRDMGQISYIDHVDTEALRARYSTHVGFDLDTIVTVDHVIGDGTIRSAAGEAAPFDYVVASHVIEHMPDLITSLQDIRSVLTDEGVLALTIPDHRRCFDALRSPSTTADLVAAHIERAAVPSPRQVFDHHASAVAWRGQISWGEEPPFDELVAIHTEAEAYERARHVASSADYDDVHCWVFTPASFARTMASLQRLGFLPFTLESCSQTSGGEFIARLRAADPDVVALATTGTTAASRWSEHAATRASIAASLPARLRRRAANSGAARLIRRVSARLAR